MLVLLGKTASGKDTIVKELVEKYGFKKIVSYTTRPMRDGEIQDVTYHFISQEEFLKKKEEGFFIEWDKYTTEFGDWYYGLATNDLKYTGEDCVTILTPKGYRDVCKLLKKQPYSIYIYANNATIKKRLELRGDDPKEAERRIKHDTEDFKDLEYEVNRIIYNNDGADINKVVDRIIEMIKVVR